MSAKRRLIGLFCFVVFVGFFWGSPDWLGLSADGLFYRALIVQIGGPIVAAIACFLAAQRSEGSDRVAWQSFGAGSGFYVVGNLIYLYYGLVGIEPGFPALPEASYFVMALFFSTGMFWFGRVQQQISRVQVYNFVLVAGAMILGSLFILSQAIANSVMTPFATMVAFLYPALWFSVAITGLLSLLLYAQGKKSFAFSLMVMAVFAEAIADFSYALQLMDGTYASGGPTQLLWVASAALIVWAALEQRVTAETMVGDRHLMRRPWQKAAEAVVPAVAIGTVLLAGSLSGSLGGGHYALVCAGLATLFAVFSGFREHWIINTQRQLRTSVEANRAALEKSQSQLSAVLESTSDSVLVLDRDLRVSYFNENAARLIAQGDRLKLGISMWELFPSAATTGEGARYLRALETGEPAEFELFVEDRKRWLGIHAYPSSEGISIFFRDISDQKRASDEILHLARHDPLTGLANRTLFQARLKEAVTFGGHFAVLLLDVDHFKEVNDTLGHPVGDALLKSIGERLRACLRPTDLVARMGGDEFVIIADGAGSVEARGLAQRIVDTAGPPHLVEGESVRLGVSVGIAISDGSERDPDRVFRNADIALYAAKAEARGAYRIFEPAMEAGMQDRQALRADLRAALGHGEFVLNYQPLVDLRTEQVSAFEALLRWHHPTRGVVSPDVFIPIAEDSGLIEAIGEWVLETACAEACKWPDDISVAVNLSTREFSNRDLAASVAASLEKTGLDPRRLELEITESVLLRDSKANLGTLRQLKALGLGIALDDFGTGYSSLAYLQQFPFSKIKIDRSFVSGLPQSESSQAIVRSVIGLGMALGMRVTAEGVETQAQYDWVKLGCNEAQGFHLSRPVPARDVPALTERINGRSQVDGAVARKAG